MTTGQRLKQLRKSKGWTQTQLASRVKVTQQVIASYEADKKRPSISRLLELAALFDVSVDEIIGGKSFEFKTNGKRVHGNSRLVKMQQLFSRLPPAEQRSILKQVAALVEKHEK